MLFLEAMSVKLSLQSIILLPWSQLGYPCLNLQKIISLQKCSILQGEGFPFEGFISTQDNRIHGIGCNPSEYANDCEPLILQI